jgi:hypothetical protein
MAYEMSLNWIKCEGVQWCNFMTVNLAHQHFVGLEGVYIIWHGGQNPHTVYVGQGKIAERLAAHRLEPQILQYLSYGLFVTWAPLNSGRDGVERFLTDVLKPLVTRRAPDVPPVRVGLPWQ